MIITLIGLAKLAILAMSTVWLASELWQAYRDAVIAWLHAHSKPTSTVRKAVVLFDALAGTVLRIKARVIIKVNTQEITVHERILTNEDILDLKRTRPGIYQSLTTKGVAEQDILSLLN